MKALIIDDSLATRFILKRIVGDLGFETVEAVDGSDALRQLSQHPDTVLALVDWNMPEMNGYEFIVEVRKNPSYSQLTLLMVTTEVEMLQVVKALEAGAQEYLMKPFTPEMIREKLQLLGILPT